MCHPVYGNGDCSEFDFCSNHGVCHKGKCLCRAGYGGRSCERQAVCHFWDVTTSQWRQEGVRTLDSPIEVGTSGVVRCAISQFPAAATEYAALWSLPPPGPTSLIQSIFLASGDVDDFDFPRRAGIRAAIANAAGSGITLNDVALNVQPASVRVTVLITVPVVSANTITRTLALGIFSSPFALQEALSAAGVTGMTVTSIETAPQVGVPEQNLSVEESIQLAQELADNPVAITVLILLILDLAHLRLAWYLGKRGLSRVGLIGLLKEDRIRWKEERIKRKAELERKKAELVIHPTAASKKGKKAQLALKGPEEVKHKNPTLSAHFEIMGDVATFDDGALLRRLATLLGVEDSAIGATLTSGADATTVVIDAEIECPDATTLVMAAKTLKKSVQPLGVALGVKFVAKPQVDVAAVDEADLAAASLGPKQAADPEKRYEKMAEKMVPTIQERIPSMVGRGIGAGIGGLGAGIGGLGASIGAGMTQLPAGMASARMLPPSTSLCGGRMPLPSSSSNMLGGPARLPVPGTQLPGGIQERIPFSGIAGAATRSKTNLRQRSAQAMASSGQRPPSAGAPSAGYMSSALVAPANLLGGLGLTMSAEGVLPNTIRMPATDGIQERLPAMPGLRRPRDGLPRSTRAPTGIQGPVQGIQERIPAMPRPKPSVPPVSPPPSPPEGTLKSVLESKSGLKLDTRLQTVSKVLPNNPMAKPEPPLASEPPVWEMRSHQEIIFGALREHTLVSAVTSTLYGDRPNLSSVAQAAQLLWCTLLGSLYLSTVQLRYAWLGATWNPATDSLPDGSKPELSDRLRNVSSVAMAAAIVCCTCILGARWLFLLANRVSTVLPEQQGKLIYNYMWSIVGLVCASLAIGAVSMSANMDVTSAREDIIVGWILAIIVQWLLIEPLMVAVLASCGLLLKWLTTFDDVVILPEAPATKNVKAKPQ